VELFNVLPTSGEARSYRSVGRILHDPLATGVTQRVARAARSRTIINVLHVLATTDAPGFAGISPTSSSRWQHQHGPPTATRLSLHSDTAIERVDADAADVKWDQRIGNRNWACAGIRPNVERDRSCSLSWSAVAPTLSSHVFVSDETQRREGGLSDEAWPGSNIGCVNAVLNVEVTGRPNLTTDGSRSFPLRLCRSTNSISVPSGYCAPCAPTIGP